MAIVTVVIVAVNACAADIEPGEPGLVARSVERAGQRARWNASAALVVGAVFALGLAGLRMSLRWFPLHPVGYAVSASWSMNQLWMSVFVAWVV